MTIGIDIHGKGGASINGRPVDAADKRHFIRSSAGGNPADGNHILIAAKTRIADVNIIAANAGIGTCIGTQGGVEITGAIFKCQVAHRSVVATRSVRKERASARGSISAAFGVASQSIQTDGCVDGSSSVTEEHAVTDSRIEIADGVAEER